MSIKLSDSHFDHIQTLKIENTVIAVVEAGKVDSTECQIKSIWLSL